MFFIAGFNVIMLLRLNRPLMPRGWEKWDIGKSDKSAGQTASSMLQYTTLQLETHACRCHWKHTHVVERERESHVVVISATIYNFVSPMRYSF